MKMRVLISYILVLSTFLSACTEVCDHIIKPDEKDDLYAYVSGSWYLVANNEEIHYAESGTFYDKFSNLSVVDEIQGRYEIDSENMRLTYNYESNGQMMFADWKMSDLTDLSFTISADQLGSHKLERIVETFNLEVGESCTISYFADKPEYSIISMKTSSRIVIIDEDSHEITATGEKGTAYIKIETNQGVAWAKVVVGDDCLDLWYDFVSFIGKDYSYMTSVLGSPSINGEDGYSFGYLFQKHGLVTEVDILMDTTTGLIDEIGIVLLGGVPTAQIKAYMNAHYYPTDVLGNGDCYTTSPSVSESVAIVQYKQDQNVVWIMDASFFKMPDYSEDLGKTEDEIVAKYGDLYYGIMPLYEVSNHYGYSIYFVISETTGAVTAAQFALVPEISVNEVNSILSERYNYYQSNETNTMFGYRNAGEEDSTIRVIYNSEDATVTWYDLLNFGK